MRYKPRTVCLAFETMHESLDRSKRLAIVGSIEELGNWKVERCVLATEKPAGSGRWIAAVNLPPMETIEWKWVVVNGSRTRVFRWEERATRIQSTGISNGRIIAPWNNTSTFSADAETSRVYIRYCGYFSYKFVNTIAYEHMSSEVRTGSSFMGRIRAGPSFTERLREAPSLLGRIRGRPSVIERIRGAPSSMDRVGDSPSMIDRFKESTCVIL